MKNLNDIVTEQIDRVSKATGQRRDAIEVSFVVSGSVSGVGYDGGWTMTASLVEFTTRTGKRRRSYPHIVRAHSDTLSDAGYRLIENIQIAVENGEQITDGGRIEVMK